MFWFAWFDLHSLYYTAMQAAKKNGPRPAGRFYKQNKALDPVPKENVAIKHIAKRVYMAMASGKYRYKLSVPKPAQSVNCPLHSGQNCDHS